MIKNPGTCPLYEDEDFSDYRIAGLLQCRFCRLVLDHSIWNDLANESMEDKWFEDGYNPDPSFWV